jgi:3-deoxy-D-manno-octulosonate 8-phosphate phosphatase KdsC-like HAD superfamily phosphatase
MLKKELCWYFDVDGVMTDGRVSYPSLERLFSVRDGHGLSIIDRNTNIYVVMMSGEGDESIELRATKLNVPFHRSKDKYGFVKQHYPRLPYIAISDDIMDIPLLQNAIIAFCPNDAEPEVINVIKNHPHGHVLSRKGGQHCVREAIDYLLNNKYLQDKFGIKVALRTEQHL